MSAGTGEQRAVHMFARKKQIKRAIARRTTANNLRAAAPDVLPTRKAPTEVGANIHSPRSAPTAAVDRLSCRVGALGADAALNLGDVAFIPCKYATFAVITRSAPSAGTRDLTTLRSAAGLGHPLLVETRGQSPGGIPRRNGNLNIDERTDAL